MIRFNQLLLSILFSLTAAADEPADFRPMVSAALGRGESRIVIPPGTYRLAPLSGDKSVWNLTNCRDVEIVADGVSLVSTKLTRVLTLTRCAGLTIRGLTIDYDPLPFTQGKITTVAEDKSWIDIRLHAGYPHKPYSRIDLVDPATRFRKRGMPFLWGTKAEMRGEDVVRVSLAGIGKAASVGDLASLSTGQDSTGIPHAVSLDGCSSVILDGVTVHSAAGMGILEGDGEGATKYLKCRVVPGPRPAGAEEDRLLSSSWDAMQTKTVRVGPWVEDCEITDAGDDSWSVQSSDYLVLARNGTTVVLASRDEYTTGVQLGDRLKSNVSGPEAKILKRRELSRAEAQLPPEVMEKLAAAKAWDDWKVSPKCIEVVLDKETSLKAGDSVYSPDRMGNGFTFINNRVHSPGRVLIKAAGRIEGNLLDTPHNLTVCPEIPNSAAAGIDGLIIRKNKILRAGWFCPAPWASPAGAISITAAGPEPQLRPAGVFADLTIEDNVFEDCLGPNLVITSTLGAKVDGNQFIRPQHGAPPDTGASYHIAKDALIWIGQCEKLELGKNPVTEPGPFLGEQVQFQQKGK